MGFGAETGASGISQVTRSTSFLLKALLPPRLAATHRWTVRAEGLGLCGLHVLCAGPCPCCAVPHCETWAGGGILSLAPPGPTGGQMIPPPSIGSQPSVDLDQKKGRHLEEISQFPSSSSLPGTTLRPCPYSFFWRKLHMLSEHTC